MKTKHSVILDKDYFSYYCDLCPKEYHMHGNDNNYKNRYECRLSHCENEQGEELKIEINDETIKL